LSAPVTGASYPPTQRRVWSSALSHRCCSPNYREVAPSFGWGTNLNQHGARTHSRAHAGLEVLLAHSPEYSEDNLPQTNCHVAICCPPCVGCGWYVPLPSPTHHAPPWLCPYRPATRFGHGAPFVLETYTHHFLERANANPSPSPSPPTHTHIFWVSCGDSRVLVGGELV
jgi:hypothetical protein